MKNVRVVMGALFAIAALSVPGTSSADPITDLTLQAYRAGWFPNYYKGKGPFSCPETCRVWANNDAEGERVTDLWQDSKYDFVCKVTRDPKIVIEAVNDPSSHWIYGSQFDDKALCYYAFPNGKAVRSQQYMCLCVNKGGCDKPDLVITKIHRPVWSSPFSKIDVDVTNIGSVAAGPSITHLEDYDRPAGVDLPTPALAPGATVTLTFQLPYWVYDPDASLDATADWKQQIDECDENNNTLRFFSLG